jgi:hypothetical protein
LNFAVYDSLLHFWRPSSITTVHDTLELAPSMFNQLTRADFRRGGAHLLRKAWFTVPV